ncbi:MAG TPA: efflux RND transporter periplasmic adaptor subunit [Terriglobia bacterium]|nr:efflux RND transporter periplasmic adaptor subunit [Terriglobia bacterium]
MAAKQYIQQHKKLVAVAVIIIIAIFTVGFMVRSHSGSVQYFTAKVTRGNIMAVVQATGTINSLTTIPVGSAVSGIVKYVFADYNTHVLAGQVLAQLDPTTFQASVTQAQGNLANAQANVANLEASVGAQQAAIESNKANLVRLQATLEYQQVNTKRNLDLASQQIISSDQKDLAVSSLDQDEAQVRAQEAAVDQSVAQLSQTRAQVKEAEAQVKEMQGALDLANKNLHDATIVSPINGVIVARNVDVGEAVAAAFQAPNLFTIAQDLKHMQVDTSTDESDTGNIKIGAEATFQVDAFPTQNFRGQVSAIRLNATTVQNVVTYDTVINFANPDEKLLPGETAYVTIPTGFARGVLRIPNAALRFKPQMAPADLQKLYTRYHIPASATRAHLGGQQVVWELAPNQQLVPVTAEIGITDYTNTEVLKSDLKEGDLLVAGELTGQGQTFTQGRPRFGGRR